MTMKRVRWTDHRRLYKVWHNMVRRCTNESSDGYKNYGGRGITVCDEWQEFDSFARWAIANGYDENAKRGECTLDRIDCNGNYEPNNCRWVDLKVQNNNRRDNWFVTHNGETMTVTQLADKHGIDADVLGQRLRKGWNIEKAVSEPVKKTMVVTFQGKTMTVEQWAEETGIKPCTIYWRLSHGWSEERTLTEQTRKRGHGR